MRRLARWIPIGALAVSASPLPVELEYDPPLDVPVAWRFAAAVDLELEHCELDIRGAEAYVHGLSIPEEGDTIALSWAARFDEMIRSADQDRPLVFERQWHELVLDLVRDGDKLIGSKSAHRESQLASETILHRWKPRARTYDVTRTMGKGKLDVAILDSLAPLLPVVPLLVDRPSPDAKEWEIDPAELVRALWPGGFGRLAGQLADVAVVVFAGWGFIFVELPPNPELWIDSVEGEVSARVAGRRTCGGEELVVVEIDVDVSSRIAPDAWVQVEGPFLDRADCRGRGIVWRWLAEGELLWLPAEHRPRSFVLDGELSVDSDLEWGSLQFAEEWRGRASIRLGAPED